MIIKGLLLHWFLIRKLKKTNIRVKHVTDPENHKNEDASISRKVNILIYCWNIQKNICTELMAFYVFSRSFKS